MGNKAKPIPAEPAVGLSPDARNFAATALKNLDSWGSVGRRVAEVVADAYRDDTAKQLAKMKAHTREVDPEHDLWGKVWASPLTMLGMGAAGGEYLLDRLTGGTSHFQVGDNALQLVDAPHATAPFTLGNVQIYPKGRGPDAVRNSYNGQPMRQGDHEAAHSAQAQRLGGIPMGLLWLRGGRDDPRNPIEMDADAYAMSHRRRRR